MVVPLILQSAEPSMLSWNELMGYSPGSKQWVIALDHMQMSPGSFRSHVSTMSECRHQPDCSCLADFLTWIGMSNMYRA